MNFLSKYFAVLIVAMLIILGIFWNIKELNDAENSDEEKVQVLSNERTDRLVSDLKKISKYESQKEIESKDQIDTLTKFQKTLYHDWNSQNIQELELIKMNVQTQREQYSNFLLNELAKKQSENDEKSETKIFAIASILPLGQSPLYFEVEKVLRDLAAGNRGWNQELFKHAYQFYALQSFFRRNNREDFTNELLEISRKPIIKENMQKIISEINTNLPQEE